MSLDGCNDPTHFHINSIFYLIYRIAAMGTEKAEGTALQVATAQEAKPVEKVMKSQSRTSIFHI